jgi:hypothetical protein
MRKDTPIPAPAATRWWSAPARFQEATVALLRRTARLRHQLPNPPWLRQPPNGIRA